MAVETLIRRTIWVSRCQCGETDVRNDNRPRERLCLCGLWVPYIEQSWVGPEWSKPKAEY